MIISTQEIKEAVKGITCEPNEGHVEKIKNYFKIFENEELTSVSSLRKKLIVLLYNYEEMYKLALKGGDTSLLSIHNLAHRAQKERDNLEREKNNLERERNEWRTKFNNKNREYEDYKEKYEKANEELYKEKLKHAKDMGDEKLKNKDDKSTSNEKISRLEEKLESKTSELIKVNRQLEGAKNELSLVRTEKDNWIAKLEDKLDEKNVIHNQKIEELNVQLNTLLLKSGKKDSELERKNEEIERLKNEAKSSDKRAEKSQEELLNGKIRSEKENLKLLATELKINLEEIDGLTRYHERLFRARKTNNRDNIETHEKNIAKIEEGFSGKISMVHIQEICRKCERIAELRWELEQSQQQFQAQQEIPIK